MTDGPNDDFLLALGQLTYQWRLTEWAAVHLAAALSADPHAVLVQLRRWTASRVADTLEAQAKSQPADADLAAVVVRFRAAVDVRNDVMHAEPSVAGLTRPGTFNPGWDPERLREITANFDGLSRDLVALRLRYAPPT